MNKTILTKRLKLTQVKLEDTSWLFQTISGNRAHLATHLPWICEITSLDSERQAIKTMQDDWDCEQKFCFTIKKIRNCVGMGMISVLSIDRSNQTCELGYWLASRYQKQGYMSEALKALEEELYQSGFKQIYLNIDSDNMRSIQLARNNHYCLDKIKKKDFTILNQIKDTFIFLKIFNR